MTCPNCERYKQSASMWRNKAYELNGTPLPWKPEELLHNTYDTVLKAIDEMRPAARVIQEGDYKGGLERIRDAASKLLTYMTGGELK